MKMNWFERLAQSLGGGVEGRERASGASKHERGKRKPHGWLTAKRKIHKRKKLARRLQRKR